MSRREASQIYRRVVLDVAARGIGVEPGRVDRIEVDGIDVNDSNLLVIRIAQVVGHGVDFGHSARVCHSCAPTVRDAVSDGGDACRRRLRNAGDGFVDDWRRLPPDDVPEGLAFDDFDVVAHITSLAQVSLTVDGNKSHL